MKTCERTRSRRQRGLFFTDENTPSALIQPWLHAANRLEEVWEHSSSLKTPEKKDGQRLATQRLKTQNSDVQVKTKKRQFKVGNLVILLSCLYFDLWITSTTLCSFCVKWKKSLFDANQSIKMWSSLQTFGVLWFKSTVPQKVLWRWRCTCVIKKRKSNKCPQTGETDNIKGKDAEKAEPGTDWKVEGSSLNIRRFRCSAEKRRRQSL